MNQSEDCNNLGLFSFILFNHDIRPFLAGVGIYQNLFGWTVVKQILADPCENRNSLVGGGNY